MTIQICRTTKIWENKSQDDNVQKNIRNDINVIFAKVICLEQLFAKKGCGDWKFQRITTQQNDYPGWQLTRRHLKGVWHAHGKGILVLVELKVCHGHDYPSSVRGALAQSLLWLHWCHALGYTWKWYFIPPFISLSTKTKSVNLACGHIERN